MEVKSMSNPMNNLGDSNPAEALSNIHGITGGEGSKEVLKQKTLEAIHSMSSQSLNCAQIAEQMVVLARSFTSTGVDKKVQEGAENIHENILKFIQTNPDLISEIMENSSDFEELKEAIQTNFLPAILKDGNISVKEILSILADLKKIERKLKEFENKVRYEIWDHLDEIEKEELKDIKKEIKHEKIKHEDAKQFEKMNKDIEQLLAQERDLSMQYTTMHHSGKSTEQELKVIQHLLQILKHILFKMVSEDSSCLQSGQNGENPEGASKALDTPVTLSESLLHEMQEALDKSDELLDAEFQREGLAFGNEAFVFAGKTAVEWAEAILSGTSDQTDLFRELERSQSSWENVMEEAASSFLDMLLGEGSSESTEKSLGKVNTKLNERNSLLSELALLINEQ
jgi:hypothetical protein